MWGRSRRTPAELEARTQRHIAAARELAEVGSYGPAIRHSDSACRIAARLLRREPMNLQHATVLGAQYYNQAVYWERVGNGRRAIDSARRAVAIYQQLRGCLRRDVGQESHPAVDRTPGQVIGDDDESIAMLADARARLARLLGSYGTPPRNGGSLGDRATALYDEIAGLDGEAGGAYLTLIEQGSRYTQADLDRITEQGNRAFAAFFTRFPRDTRR